MPDQVSQVALAVDIGSSSVRVMAYTADGNAVPGLESHRSYNPVLTADGGVEFDPPQLRDTVFSCLDEAFASPATASVEIVAVGIDTFATNLFGVDSAGKPITPLYLWNDTRSHAYVARLNLDPAAAYERTGAPHHVSYWPSRLLWLKATQPEIFQRVTRWLSIGEWIQETLFGVTQVSTSLAAWTGMLDRRSADWDAETLRAAGITREHLSPISDQPFNVLSDQFVKRWPALRHTRWLPAIADGYAANVGCGAITPNWAALTIGTSGAIRVLMPGVPDQVPAGLFCYRVNADQSLVGGAVSNAGNVFAWLQQTLRITGDPFDQSTEPGSHGLTVLPFWAGERSSGWHANAQATISGMTLSTTADDIARASLEAVLYRIAAIDEVLSEALNQPPAIYAAGGVLANSPGWAQISADVFGRDVSLCADSQTTLRGTALLALNTQAQPVISAVYHPRLAYTIRHANLRDNQQRAYDLAFHSH